MDFLSLLAIAFAPGIAIGVFIYLKDHHEREPLYLLLLCFLYGCLSTAVTLLITMPVNLLLATRANDIMSQFISAFFKVALIEEFSKFVFLRFILYRNEHFNEPFDGIVYAVMVGMGFATLENVVYVFELGFMTGLLRMFSAVPAHAVFAIMMGYFLGLAKFSHRHVLRYSLLALLIPTLFHGAYDYFLFIAEINGVYAGVWIGSAIALVTGVILSRRAIALHQDASPFRQRNESDSSG